LTFYHKKLLSRTCCDVYTVLKSIPLIKDKLTFRNFVLNGLAKRSFNIVSPGNIVFLLSFKRLSEKIIKFTGNRVLSNNKLKVYSGSTHAVAYYEFFIFAFLILVYSIFYIVKKLVLNIRY